MHPIAKLFALAGTALVAAAGVAAAQDHVTFGTNWLAQAEHGGFYQAVADGTYARYGLDVTIIPGGPDVANRARLVTGQVDFYLGGTLDAFDAAREDMPTVNIAAFFQKDPQVLLAHPNRGFTKLGDLAVLSTLYIGGDGYDSYYRWIKSAFPGFTDEQVKPYTFNPAPFIVDDDSGQQGYLSSEPFDIKAQTGWEPSAFLLSDYGWQSYSDNIQTTSTLVADNPDLVQRFIDASTIGWYNYLYGDNSAANALIRADNPEMTDDRLAYGVEQMKTHGIVVSGDAETMGIGCQTAERYQSFYDDMIKAGVLEAGIDLTKVFTTQFVCKGVGLDVLKQLTGG